MNNTYPIGTPLTFVWRFQTPDGKAIAFDSSRHSFALRYTTGRGTKTIDTFAVNAGGDGITWTLPAEQQFFLGAYDLVLDIFLQGSILEHYYFRHAFAFYRAGDNTINTDQYKEAQTINLLSIGEFYHFTPNDARLSALETELALFNKEFNTRLDGFAQEFEDEIERIRREGVEVVGKSAYESAVDHGYVGTEEEWLESLHGEDGATGAKGDKGDKGDPGQGFFGFHLAGENLILTQSEQTTASFRIEGTQLLMTF